MVVNGGTAAGNRANYMVGASYLHIGEFAKAIQYLEDFDGNGASQVQSKAYLLMGHAYAEQKKTSEALSNYKKAASVAIKQLKVPGAFEIPFAIHAYWETTKYHSCKADAFIALGCVIKGDTPHFEYVCSAVTNGIAELNLKLPVPSIFGVLTVNNQEQADERTGGIHGHKGEEAAATAIKMIALSQSF